MTDQQPPTAGGDHRSWDSEARADHAASPIPPRNKRGALPYLLITVGAGLALAVLLVVAGALAGGEDDEAAQTSTTTEVPATEAPTTAGETPTPAPLAEPDSCTEASAADVEAIEFYLREDATLGEAFTAEEGGHRWVTANVYPAGGGDRLASAAEWVFIDGTFALTTSSSSAAERSEGLAEARSLGVYPRPVSGELTQCVTAALRAQNGSR